MKDIKTWIVSKISFKTASKSLKDKVEEIEINNKNNFSGFLKFLIFVYIVTNYSCTSKTYSEYYSFKNNLWHTDSIIEFEFNIIDTINKYDLTLNIRHTVDYEFQNLFVFVDAETRDTIELNLASKNGKWLGKGVGDVREIKHVINKQKTFSNSGIQKIKVEQAMRYGSQKDIQNLENILGVGLTVTLKNE